MKTITKKVFAIDELSEKAKETAYYNWLNKTDHWYIHDDWKKLLETVENTFNCDVINYNIDSCNSWINFQANSDDEILQLSGKRLLAYIWNNYRHIWQGKCYSSTTGTPPEFKWTKRRSRVISSLDDCPFTGCCNDYAVTDEIKKLWRKRHYQDTFYQFLECVFNSIAEHWQKDIEYHESREFFLEECENQKLFFSEDGKEMFYSLELD